MRWNFYIHAKVVTQIGEYFVSVKFDLNSLCKFTLSVLNDEIII